MSHTPATLSFADDVRQASKGCMYEDEFEKCCAEIDRVTKQRDTLLAAGKSIVEFCDKNPPMGESLYCIQLMREAIAAIEGGAR